MAKQHSRTELVGATFWVLNLQYFIVQVVVARAWLPGFSLAHNTISDLGNSACGQYSGRFVCSPQHSLMNTSFIVLAITIILGATLLMKTCAKNRGAVIGFTFLLLAGVGTALVGLFPENTVADLHVSGAALSFLFGNLALLLLGASLSIGRWFRCYSFLSGVLALIALILFVTHSYLGLGAGTIERFTAYPQTIWMIAYGILLLQPEAGWRKR